MEVIQNSHFLIAALQNFVTFLETVFHLLICTFCIFAHLFCNFIEQHILMKQLFFLSIIVLLVSACKKNSGPSGPLIKGKLVRNLCVDPLVQILDSSYYYLGENWLDTNRTDGPLLREHVFTVTNPCNYSDPHLQEGTEFYFRIWDEASDDCAVCAMYVESPATRHKIKIDQ